MSKRYLGGGEPTKKEDTTRMVFDEKGFQKEYEESFGNRMPSVEDHMITVPALSAVSTSAQRQTFEGEVSPERYKIQGVYNTGAHSVIYRARDGKTGRTVAIKKHEHYFPKEGGDANEIRDAEDRFKREAQILAKLHHPGIVDAYGYFFKEDDFRRKPFLVTELIDHPSLDELMEKGKTFDEQDARQVVLSVGIPINYMHTTNGRPIVYRDLKPDNVKVMPEDAQWPHKLVDFSESKIGKATMSGSVIGTVGYNAPETYGGGIADQSGDFYSLMRIATHMIVGDNNKFMATWFGNASLRNMKEQGDLNVSEQFLKAIERATSRDPSHRYKTLAELAGDLGYNLERIPETRQELETILGHKSLPVRIEAEKQEVVEKYGWIRPQSGDSPLGVCVRDDKINIDGVEFDTGKDVYHTIKKIRDATKRKGDSGGGVKHDTLPGRNLSTAIDDEQSINTILYLQYIAPQYPEIQAALEGKRSLEDAVREVRKIEDYRERNKQATQLMNIFSRYGAFFDLEDFFWNGSLVEPGNNPTFSIVFPIVYPIQLHKRKKVLAKAREIDSWIEEARRIQNPSSLEIKAGESVELTEREKRKIYDGLPKNLGEAMIYSLVLGGTAIGGILNGGDGAFIGVTLGSLLSISALPTAWITNYFLRNRALKEKRLAAYAAAGLDEDGMREYARFVISDAESGKNPNFESPFRLKKRFLKREMVGEGVKVKYHSKPLGYNRIGNDGTFSEIAIYARPEEEDKARKIYDDMNNNWILENPRLKFTLDPLQPFPAGTILSDGKKMPDVRRIGRIGGKKG